MAEWVDLSEILHNQGMRQPYEVNVPCDEELELTCRSPAKGRVVFSNTGNVLVVDGEVALELETQCPRCLQPVVSKVVAPIREGFTTEAEQITGRADDEELGLNDPTLKALFSGHMMNVTELVRQSVVLAAPGEPLCAEDCPGLAPAGEQEDDHSGSPFAALAQLYKNQDASEEKDA
jgi:uncharacterized metal-binding protein YceD (DUF177 family)